MKIDPQPELPEPPMPHPEPTPRVAAKDWRFIATMLREAEAMGRRLELIERQLGLVSQRRAASHQTLLRAELRALERTTAQRRREAR